MNELERAVGRVLQIGVTISAVALIAGFISTSSALLTVGVLVLIGTPVARVLFSAILYARRRDWLFTLLTMIVLGELLASIVAAVKG